MDEGENENENETMSYTVQEFPAEDHILLVNFSCGRVTRHRLLISMLCGFEERQ